MLWVVCNIIVWISGTIAAAEVSSSSEILTQDKLAISLTIYISSVIATAIATWTIAKYDNKRVQEIRDLKSQLEKISRSICKYPAIKNCNDCAFKNECDIRTYGKER